MTTPAGWYPDPSGASGQRYFDGAEWTDHHTPPAAAAPATLSAPPPAPAPAKRNNIIGIIALVTSIIGLVFACIPGALVVGWVLLPTAFVLGIVGLFLTGRARGTSVAAIVVSIVGTVVGVVVFFTVVSDSFQDAFNDSDLSASSPTPDGSTSSPTSANDGGDGNQPGSRENPFPIGQTVSNEDWDVTLGAPREAWTEVSSENQFNDPPESGMEFWIVPVTATYKGDETGNTTFGISVKFVGSDNRTYSEGCGVIPTPLSDVGDLYKGGVAAGNTCVAVPAGADGLWTVTTGFIGEPVFFGP